MGSDESPLRDLRRPSLESQTLFKSRPNHALRYALSWISRWSVLSVLVLNLATWALLFEASSVHKFPLYGAGDKGKTLPAPVHHRRAVVSTLYDDNYALALKVLGHSIQRENISARRVLLYFPDRISPQTLCELKAEGWEMRPTESLSSGREGIPDRYRDQFTKLRLWQLTEFDQVLYLDGDTIVTNNFDELWDHPADFAAVPDIWIDRGFTLDFNAGILLIKPNQTTFEELVQKINKVQWNPDWAEQGFLNEVYRVHMHRLPVAYNANLAMRLIYRELWDQMRPNFKIVHFTMTKPHWFPEQRDVQKGGDYEEIFDYWWKMRDEMESLNRSASCRISQNPA